MKRVVFGLIAVAALVLAQGVANAGTPIQALEAPAAPLDDPAQPAPPVFDPGQKGPFEVGFTSFLLVDPSRPGDGSTYPNRPIPVYVWYPVDPATVSGSTPEAVYPLDPLYGVVPGSASSYWEAYGFDRAYQEPGVSASRPFPLLLFSPGWGGPAWLHASVGTRLASHGFVVAVLYHYGDQWWGWEPPYDNVAVAAYNRPRDVSFALTDLLAKNGTPGNLLSGAIRPSQVAAGGWSLGGYASMVLAGGDDSVCDTLYGVDVEDPPAWTCAPSPPDPRIKAIVPQDGSNWCLHFYELRRITVPAMGLGEEWSMLESWNDPPWESWQARQHAAFSSQPAYRVDVFNTIHQSYFDICEGAQVLGDMGIFDPGTVAYFLDNLCTPYTPSTDVHRLVNKYMIAFLKTNLAREPGYHNMLTPGWALTNEQYIEFFVTEKRSPRAIRDEWPGDFVYFPHQPGSRQTHAAKDPARTFRVQRVLEQR